MQNDLSYIRNSGCFVEKIKSFGEIPENRLLVTADVVGLYPSIPDVTGLIAEFGLSNNYFEFDGQTL